MKAGVTISIIEEQKGKTAARSHRRTVGPRGRATATSSVAMKRGVPSTMMPGFDGVVSDRRSVEYRQLSAHARSQEVAREDRDDAQTLDVRRDGVPRRGRAPRRRVAAVAGARSHHISKETGLLKEWPSAGPKVLWTTRPRCRIRVPCHPRRPLTAGRNGGTEHVICAESRRWPAGLDDAMGAAGPGSGRGPAARRPSTAIALRADRGRRPGLPEDDCDVVWKRNILRDFGGRNPYWLSANLR